MTFDFTITVPAPWNVLCLTIQFVHLFTSKIPQTTPFGTKCTIFMNMVSGCSAKHVYTLGQQRLSTQHLVVGHIALHTSLAVDPCPPSITDTLEAIDEVFALAMKTWAGLALVDICQKGTTVPLYYITEIAQWHKTFESLILSASINYMHVHCPGTLLTSQLLLFYL